MTTFLVVAPPLAGHVNPLVALAAELEARGHHVTWVVHSDLVGSLLPPGAGLIDVAPDEDVTELLRTNRARFVRGLDSVRFFFEEAVAPLTMQMLPVVRHAIETLQPDCVIADQHALAGAFAAREAGKPWITSSPTSALYPSGAAERLPGLHEWMRGRLAALEADAGLPPADRPDVSPTLVLVHSSRLFVGDGGEAPPTYRFHGPLIGGRPPRERLDVRLLAADRPSVLVTLGSMSWEHGARFHRAAAEAADRLGCQIFIDGPAEHLAAPSSQVVIAPRLPVLELLEHVDAVVCHAGANSIHEALANGVPLVVAPVRDDQPIFAERVEATACGVRVKFARVDGAKLARALGAVLEDPAYRGAAVELQRSFVEGGGVRAAAASVLSVGSGESQADGGGALSVSSSAAR